MNEPERDFSARGISRELHMSHATVLNHIMVLRKLDLIHQKNKTLYPTYYANTESKVLKFHKKNAIVFLLEQSGLIEAIREATLPSSVILFGSCAKGVYTKGSDIDIFVEAKEATIDVSKYERKLKRKINLLFESSISSLSRELRNNIINGKILHGFIKI